jgi:hypothetical protein
VLELQAVWGASGNRPAAGFLTHTHSVGISIKSIKRRGSFGL